eukprot:TRINITY_DN21928_c0_g1_i2.p1 TRINITY_DN21928_c0_g1~~TRINITY_DN21928_c0_g1_i2.p1  ORF type:complete len:816 (+),score=200.81 TRINITY_DN21928_c0_g1_i2:409-2856(+)
MCTKIVALGFVLHEKAYLRDAWNWLDFLIVIISVVSLAATDIGLGYLKVLRTFRGLRPLRVITHNRALRIVVRALFKSLKGIANVAMICTFNYVVFGILGIQLFSGSFYRCTDETITTRLNCTGTYIGLDNATEVRRWKNAPRNYDNLLEALLTLFEVSCLEWWPPVMWDSVDHVDYDHAPERDRNIVYALFYIAFITIASFILLNMFVGVVISNFNNVKNHMDGVSLLTDEQRMWVDTQRLMLTFSPQPLLHAGAWKLSRLSHKIVTHFVFDIVVGVCIIGNTIILAVDHYGQPAAMETALGWANDVFSAFFIVECIMKLVAFELRYFLDDWNKFDFFLVVMSIVNFSLRAVQDAININILQVFRVLRILRVVRLVKQARKVRILLLSLFYSLPSLANIGGLMGLLFFLYAVIGVQVFYNVDSGEILDKRYSNFYHFWNAFGMLFRILTVTDWNMAMHDCMVQPPYCSDADPAASNCGSPAAPLYFISFLVLTAYILNQLLVAIILDNFNATARLERSSLQLSDVQRFVDVWAQFDPKATMRIPTNQFKDLVARLRPPLGISRVKSRLELLRLAQQFLIREHNGEIHFIETLIPLARNTLEVELNMREMREHEEEWRRSLPDLHEMPVFRIHGSVPATVDMYLSVILIQAAFRGQQARRYAQQLREERAKEASAYIAKEQKRGAKSHLAQDPKKVSLRAHNAGASIDNIVGDPKRRTNDEVVNLSSLASTGHKLATSTDGKFLTPTLSGGSWGAPAGSDEGNGSASSSRRGTITSVEPITESSPFAVAEENGHHPAMVLAEHLMACPSPTPSAL